MTALKRQPAEIVLHTLAFLPLVDLYRCRWVNQQWYDIVTQNRRLWTVLDRVPVKKLARFLALSGSLPVSLVLECDVETQYEYVCNVVRLHLGRISHLDLVINRQGWTSDMDDAPLLALSNTPAPVLCDLKLDSGCARAVIHGHVFQASAPHLRRVHLDGFEILAVQPAFSAVTHFTGLTESCPDDNNSPPISVFSHISAFMSHFPSVRHLHLTEVECFRTLVLGPSNTFPRHLDTLRLDYRRNTAFELSQPAFEALCYVNWAHLRSLSITNPPAGLVSLIVSEIRDAETLALDRGTDGAYLQLTTRSGKVLRFTVLQPMDLEFIQYRADPVIWNIDHVLLGPHTLEDFGAGFISRIVGGTPNARVLTVVLPLRPSMDPARDLATEVLNYRNWTFAVPNRRALLVPSLEELRITASPCALDAPLIHDSTVSLFVQSVLLREDIPLLSLWRVHMKQYGWPRRWTAKCAHWTSFELPL